MTNNRIDPTAAPTEPAARAVSPTGAPWIPPAVVPYLVALGGVAGSVIALAPEHTIAHRVSVAVLGILGLLGLASPGLRRRQ